MWLLSLFAVPGAIVAEDLKLQRYGAPEVYASYMNSVAALYDELFTTRNYKTRLSPVYERMPDNYTESPVPRFNVHLSLDHAKIFSVDVSSQVISMFMAVNYEWQDWRLAWIPSEYGGIEEIWTNADDVWIPENMIADARSIDLVYPEQQRSVNIQANGSVFVAVSLYIEASCQLNVSRFPFDHQECFVTFLQHPYKYKFVTSTGSIGGGADPASTGNGEWNVRNINVVTTTVPGGMDQLTLLGFVFQMDRVPNFYIYVVAMPCLILTLLSIIGMFWSPNYCDEQLAKLSIGLTSLISQTVLLDLVSSSIPRTASFPILGIYVVFCVILTSLACVFVVAFTISRNPPEKPPKSKEEKSESNLVSQIKRLFRKRHILFHLFFQGLNLAGFVAFISFWR